MKISTYWFCFAIAFGVLCLFPMSIRVQPRFPESLNILAAVYFLHAFDETWRDWIFITHLLTASIFAVVATQIIQRRSERDRTSPRFSMRHLLIVTAIVASIFAIFTQFSVFGSYKVGALIPFVGYVTSIYLVGLLDQDCDS